MKQRHANLVLGEKQYFYRQKYWESVPGWEIIWTTFRSIKVQGRIREQEKSIVFVAWSLLIWKEKRRPVTWMILQ